MWDWKPEAVMDRLSLSADPAELAEYWTERAKQARDMSQRKDEPGGPGYLLAQADLYERTAKALASGKTGAHAELVAEAERAIPIYEGRAGTVAASRMVRRLVDALREATGV